MATTTTKLGLTKPDFVDVVDITELNTNADEIDAAVGMAIVTSSTRPSSPWTGQIIFETDTLVPYVWDGSAWQVSGGGGGGVTVSDTAPSSPSEGDLWWDSGDGKLFVYYNDGSSSQWVDAAGPSVAVQSSAPTGYEGQLWLDDTDGSMYVYYTDPGGGSSQWIGAVSRSGGILQVVSTTKTDVFSTSSSSKVDITGLSATITPRSTSSKILVAISITHGASASTSTEFRVMRDTTAILDAAGYAYSFRGNFGFDSQNANEIFMANFGHLDSPASTSSLTYKVQVSSSAATTYVNRTNSGPQNASVSSITLMEVAG